MVAAVGIRSPTWQDGEWRRGWGGRGRRGRFRRRGSRGRRGSCGRRCRCRCHEIKAHFMGVRLEVQPRKRREPVFNRVPRPFDFPSPVQVV
jgi:hypothetical protein